MNGNKTILVLVERHKVGSISKRANAKNEEPEAGSSGSSRRLV